MTAEVLLEVALTPGLFHAEPSRATVGIVVDALRATSTLATLFAFGARGVELPAGLRQARALAARGCLVAAEVPSGAQARGCPLPVSPSLLAAAAVRGREVVFCTTNGTRAARVAARRVDELLFGSLLNASAAAEHALALAAPARGRIVVVCAGRHLNRIPCLDDTYTAGVLLGRVQAAAQRLGLSLTLGDGARIALAVVAAYPSPLEAFQRSATAEVLRRARRAPDIAFCARLDATQAVPALARHGATRPRWPVTLSAPLLGKTAA